MRKIRVENTPTFENFARHVPDIPSGVAKPDGSAPPPGFFKGQPRGFLSIGWRFATVAAK
jgi:hypothetical protein